MSKAFFFYFRRDTQCIKICIKSARIKEIAQNCETLAWRTIKRPTRFGRRVHTRLQFTTLQNSRNSKVTICIGYIQVRSKKEQLRLQWEVYESTHMEVLTGSMCVYTSYTLPTWNCSQSGYKASLALRIQTAARRRATRLHDIISTELKRTEKKAHFPDKYYSKSWLSSIFLTNR